MPPGEPPRPDEPTPPRWRRFRYDLFGALLALVILGVAALWHFGPAGTMQWVLSRLAARTGGTVSIYGMTGDLYGKSHLDRLVYQRPGMQVIAYNVSMDWALAGKSHNQLVVRSLSADKLTIESQPGKAAPQQLPQSLQLPVNLDLRHVQVRQVIYRAGESTYDFHDLQFNLQASQRQYALNLQNITTPWGSLAGNARLGQQRPFALQGQMQLGTAAAGRNYMANVQLAGSLADLQIHSDAHVGGGNAQLDLRLTPYGRRLVQQVSLHARHVHPEQLFKGAPKADLQADINARAGQQTGLTGTLAVANAIPGRYSDQRLPLKTLRSDLAGTLQGARLDHVLLDLGAAGQFQGSGDWEPGNIHLALHTANLNLNGLHGRLRTTHLAGPLTLVQQGLTDRVTANLAEGPYRLALDVQQLQDTLRLNRILISHGTGQLDLSGQLQMAHARPFQVNGRLVHFNPAAYGSFPAGNINALLSGRGRLAPAWQALVKFTISDSRLRNQPLRGNGQVNILPGRLANTDISLLLGQNQLHALGGLGTDRDVLNLKINAPALAQLGLGFAGRLQAVGSLRGTLHNPAAQFKVAATGLRLPGQQQIDRLQGVVNLGARMTDPFQGDVTFAGLHVGGYAFDTGRLQVRGTRGRHAITLAVKNPVLDADAAVSGGFLPAGGWAGTVSRFVNRGRYAARLTSPARLAVGSGTLSVQNANLALAAGFLSIQDLTRTPQRLSTRGSARNVPVALIDSVVPLKLPVGTEGLVIGGNWNLVAAQAINGTFTLQRAAGDLVLPGRPARPLGLSRLVLAGQIRDNRLVLHGELNTAALGSANVNLQTVLARQAGGVGLAANAPIHTTGTASGLPLALVLTLAYQPLPVQSNGFLLAGNWNLAIDQTVNGTFALHRQAGDLTVAAAQPFSLGLTHADLTGRITGGRIQLAGTLASSQYGHATFTLQTEMLRRGNGWGFSPAAPLLLRASADVPNLAFLNAYNHSPIELNGHLVLDVTGHGTLGQPILAGHLAASQLHISWPDEGVDLHNGTLSADFSGQQLLVRNLTLYGNQGVITATGTVANVQQSPTANLHFTASHVQLLHAPDRNLVVSGTGMVVASASRLRVTGDLTADSGRIQWVETSVPVVSKDVVVLGRPKPVPRPNALAAIPASVDLNLDLGNNFYFSGRGASAQLVGRVRITSEQYAPPQVFGTVRARNGTYTAYNQQLVLQRGIINFNGPLGDPDLNILAMRQDLPVRVGVNVTGSVQAPVIKLVSNPEMPETEKLSYLVLGHGLSGSGTSDLQLLTGAASDLYASGVTLPLSSQIVQSAGLNELNLVGGSGLANSLLTFGRRLSNKLYVSYEQSLTGGFLINLHYVLTRAWSIQAQTGSAQAVDLFYTHSWD